MKEKTLIFQDLKDFFQALKEIKETKGLFLDGEAPVPPLHSLNIKIKGRDKYELFFEGEVVNIIGKNKFAVLLKNFDLQMIVKICEEVETILKKEEKSGDYKAEGEGEKEIPFYIAVKDMPVMEKKKRALTGTLTERRILIKDRMEGIHIFVLKNKKITEEEVIDYSSLSTLSSEALTYISRTEEFIKIPQVIFNLVRNPKTPSSIALKLLPKLSISEIRYLAKGERVKTIIARAARKRLSELGLS